MQVIREIVKQAVKLASSRRRQRKIPLCALARSTVAAFRRQAIRSKDFRYPLNCERWFAIEVQCVQPSTVPSRLRGGVDYMCQTLRPAPPKLSIGNSLGG